MQPIDLNPLIVDNLYEEGLCLAEEARRLFEAEALLAARSDRAVHAALRDEVLRSTTRMMHAIAWLLNQRSYFAGEMSRYQLQAHGRLPPAGAAMPEEDMALLPAAIIDLARRTVAFHARIVRFDKAQDERTDPETAPVGHMHERLACAIPR